MEKQIDYLVFIGRFEPFHNGHLAVARKALELGKKLIIIIGSANAPRTIKNPWTVSERATMIRMALKGYEDRLIIGQVRDHLYNEDQWITDVQRVVRDVVKNDCGADTGEKICLIGQDKDQSSYYLKQFPQWPVIDVQHTAVQSATELRGYLFAAGQIETHGGMMFIRSNVPGAVYEMIDAFRHNSPDFRQLVREYNFINDYKDQFTGSPYPVQHQTADSVVVYSGHVLLVRRRSEPGKGLWALPGGFVKPNQTSQQASLAELREETRLKIPAPILQAACKASRNFDHPDRSLRGRTFTQAFYYHFQSGELPQVKAADDADKTRWVPISEALEMGPRLFEDHLDIIEYFLGQTASQQESLVD